MQLEEIFNDQKFKELLQQTISSPEFNQLRQQLEQQQNQASSNQGQTPSAQTEQIAIAKELLNKNKNFSSNTSTLLLKEAAKRINYPQWTYRSYVGLSYLTSILPNLVSLDFGKLTVFAIYFILPMHPRLPSGKHLNQLDVSNYPNNISISGNLVASASFLFLATPLIYYYLTESFNYWTSYITDEPSPQLIEITSFFFNLLASKAGAEIVKYCLPLCQAIGTELAPPTEKAVTIATPYVKSAVNQTTPYIKSAFTNSIAVAKQALVTTKAHVLMGTAPILEFLQVQQLYQAWAIWSQNSKREFQHSKTRLRYANKKQEPIKVIKKLASLLNTSKLEDLGALIELINNVEQNQKDAKLLGIKINDYFTPSLLLQKHGNELLAKINPHITANYEIEFKQQELMNTIKELKQQKEQAENDVKIPVELQEEKQRLEKLTKDKQLQHQEICKRIKKLEETKKTLEFSNNLGKSLQGNEFQNLFAALSKDAPANNNPFGHLMTNLQQTVTEGQQKKQTELTKVNQDLKNLCEKKSTVEQTKQQIQEKLRLANEQIAAVYQSASSGLCKEIEKQEQLLKEKQASQDSQPDLTLDILTYTIEYLIEYFNDNKLPFVEKCSLDKSQHLTEKLEQLSKALIIIKNKLFKEFNTAIKIDTQLQSEPIKDIAFGKDRGLVGNKLQKLSKLLVKTCELIDCTELELSICHFTIEERLSEQANYTNLSNEADQIYDRADEHLTYDCADEHLTNALQLLLNALVCTNSQNWNFAWKTYLKYVSQTDSREQDEWQQTYKTATLHKKDNPLIAYAYFRNTIYLIDDLFKIYKASQSNNKVLEKVDTHTKNQIKRHNVTLKHMLENEATIGKDLQSHLARSHYNCANMLHNISKQISNPVYKFYILQRAKAHMQTAIASGKDIMVGVRKLSEVASQSIESILDDIKKLPQPIRDTIAPSDKTSFNLKY